ncbi:rhomboid family intramembrane serine protease [Campylobacter hepaticus]|uniref:Rhomboid family intramembrane serine protease n=1 Tax=Campylobacter hepaticus TaxID=1813019 RepID=A0A6A7JU27_9BACT|nr:rhomboid family intramembrane serine protease [Campylobacter hepaticus]AXP08497.1 rhomboid family intramembrane serine protease [Campylobacter hepaticus]MCZ0772333.1 rhomboid family intramembrane serine protease [Campylobacter hepaticus]MCZ0773801.1 rhomboid family intramembrane serine protease [Campylobacter hepaticus]MCZ0775052.1 rhomboid family intramembrane serine protease [Campylobacter hepaticus]MDX2322921.1 rhomboid family intramembrane serine protease [Campylobacter hepaticus]
MFTLFLIFLNILLYFLISYDYHNILGLNIFFFHGAYWQLLSTMFIHGNFTHLILNMIVLFQFGRILETYLGSLRFALLYLGGGLLCSLLSAFYVYFDFVYFRTSIKLVGASGAICVLMGFYSFVDKSSTKGLIVAVLLMSFVPLFMGINVAWYGHIFGFICGYILAKLKR